MSTSQKTINRRLKFPTYPGRFATMYKASLGTDPIYGSATRSRVEAAIKDVNSKATLIPLDHHPDVMFPPAATIFGFQRVTDYARIPIGSRGPACTKDSKATTCHKSGGNVPGFMYTHKSLTCAACEEKGLPTIIYRYVVRSERIGQKTLSEAVAQSCWHCFTKAYTGCSIQNKSCDEAPGEDYAEDIRDELEDDFEEEEGSARPETQSHQPDSSIASASASSALGRPGASKDQPAPGSSTDHPAPMLPDDQYIFDALDGPRTPLPSDHHGSSSNRAKGLSTFPNIWSSRTQPERSTDVAPSPLDTRPPPRKERFIDLRENPLSNPPPSFPTSSPSSPSKSTLWRTYLNKIENPEAAIGTESSDFAARPAPSASTPARSVQPNANRPGPRQLADSQAASTDPPSPQPAATASNRPPPPLTSTQPTDAEPKTARIRDQLSSCLSQLSQSARTHATAIESGVSSINQLAGELIRATASYERQAAIDRGKLTSAVARVNELTANSKKMDSILVDARKRANDQAAQVDKLRTQLQKSSDEADRLRNDNATFQDRHAEATADRDQAEQAVRDAHQQRDTAIARQLEAESALRDASREIESLQDGRAADAVRISDLDRQVAGLMGLAPTGNTQSEVEGVGPVADIPEQETEIEGEGDAPNQVSREL